MANEVALTIKVAPGANLGTISANQLDVTFQAGDATLHNKFSCTGRELVFMRNVAVAAKTVTFTSQPNARKRTGDITTYSIGASEFALVGPFPLVGWGDANGQVIVTPETADVEFLVVRF